MRLLLGNALDVVNLLVEKKLSRALSEVSPFFLFSALCSLAS